MLAHEQPDFPGENFVNESKIIENIIRDLAPELLQQPTVLSRIYAYIFTAPGQHQPSFTQLRRCMDEAMSDHSKANLTTLSSIIKGALRFRTALSIASFPAFDQELHIRKEKILSEIFDPETAPDPLPSTLHTGKNN